MTVQLHKGMTSLNFDVLKYHLNLHINNITCRSQGDYHHSQGDYHHS